MKKTFKHITGVFLLCVLVFFPMYGNNTDLEEITILIEREQHATAHNRLWRINHLDHATDTTICLMVKNAFEGNIYHTNYFRFFMVDKTIYVESETFSSVNKENDTLIVSFSRPEQWIKRALEINPENGMAFYLLGFYYYKSKLPELSLDSPISNDGDELEREIAVLYEKAFKYGYRHKTIFRFLGEYYSKQRIIHRAKRFYRWNAMERYFDSESVLQLATIYQNEAKSQKALELAFSALSHLQDAEFNLKYLALRIIADANRELKHPDKFKYYNQLCLQLIPEQSDAYLDMVEFYDQQEKIDSIMLWMNKLFSQNPFDAKNYKMVDYISRKYKNFNELLSLLNKNREDYSQYDAVLAYSWWAQGDIYYHSEKKGLARKAWSKSKEYFLKFINPRDPIFKKIGKVKK